MADPLTTVTAIINNAMAVANDSVVNADLAARTAIDASQGHAYPARSWVEYTVGAIEPAVPEVADTTLTYEAQRDQLIALLSAKLADYFIQYYPLASDAYDEGTNWLINAITVGGTGLQPAIVEQIWGSDRDRVISDGLRAESQTVNEFAMRGFSLPAGAMAARLQEIRFEQLAKTQEQSRDAAIQQAKIEIDNLKFAVDLAVKTRISALNAAADYIRALMSGPETAYRVASMIIDAKARMMSATADLYRARLQRDELAMKVPLANMDNLTKYTAVDTDAFYKGISARVQAADAAAQVYGQSAAAALSSLTSIAGVMSSA